MENQNSISGQSPQNLHSIQQNSQKIQQKDEERKQQVVQGGFFENEEYANFNGQNNENFYDQNNQFNYQRNQGDHKQRQQNVENMGEFYEGENSIEYSQNEQSFQDESGGKFASMSMKSTKIRRSKDAQGTRDHKCAYCSKTYLSYPALYTHQRNKHSNKQNNPGNNFANESGFNLIGNMTNRGRGRPKKTNVGSLNQNYSASILNNGSLQQFYGSRSKFNQEPQNESFFMTPKRAGGPVYPHSVFKEIYNDIYFEKNIQNEENKNEQEEKIQIDQNDEELQRIELLKQTEFKSHPLYPLLVQYSEDLKQFIEEKRNEYLLQAQNIEKMNKLNSSFGISKQPNYQWVTNTQQDNQKLQDNKLGDQKDQMKDNMNEMNQQSFKQNVESQKEEIYEQDSVNEIKNENTLSQDIDEEDRLNQNNSLWNENNINQEQANNNKMHPKTPMIATKPPNNIQPLFSTRKIYRNWPKYMFKENQGNELENEFDMNVQQDQNIYEQKSFSDDNISNFKNENFQQQGQTEFKNFNNSYQNMDDQYCKIPKSSLLVQFKQMLPQQKQTLSCDSVFAIYLAQASQYVNQDYYKILMRFIMLYRQCLNEIGWFKRREHLLKCGWRLEDDSIYMKVLKDENRAHLVNLMAQDHEESINSEYKGEINQNQKHVRFEDDNQNLQNQYNIYNSNNQRGQQDIDEEDYGQEDFDENGEDEQEENDEYGEEENQDMDEQGEDDLDNKIIYGNEDDDDDLPQSKEMYQQYDDMKEGGENEQSDLIEKQENDAASSAEDAQQNLQVCSNQEFQNQQDENQDTTQPINMQEKYAQLVQQQLEQKKKELEEVNHKIKMYSTPNSNQQNLIGGVGNTIDINDLMQMEDVVQAAKEKEKEIIEERERLQQLFKNQQANGEICHEDIDSNDSNQQNFEEKEVYVADQKHSLKQIGREQMLEIQKKQEQNSQLKNQDEKDEDLNYLMSPFNTSYVLPNTEYSTVCNADFAPLICNEFIQFFLNSQQNDNNLENQIFFTQKLDRKEAIDLTRHLCNWLSTQGLTCAVIATK